MNTIIERITEAIKDILIGLIKSSLDNMFTSVNEQVGTIAGQGRWDRHRRDGMQGFLI